MATVPIYSIKVLELPDLPRKGDVSDWFQKGRSVEQFLKLIEEAPAWDPDGDGHVPYVSTPRGFFYFMTKNEIEVQVRLTNFTARITAEIIEDDGQEEKRFFELEASRKGKRGRWGNRFHRCDRGGPRHR